MSDATGSGSATARRRQASTGPTNQTEAPAVEITGANLAQKAKMAAPRRQRRTSVIATATTSASSAVESSGATEKANAKATAPQQREAMADANASDPPPPADLVTTTCLRLAELQKVRMFCIVSQSRCDRSIESAIARCLGFDAGATEAERKAVFARAKSIRLAVEGDKPFDPLHPGDQRAESLAAFLPLIPVSAQARSMWDVQRDGVQAEMERLVATLPIYAWTKQHMRGLGEMGLARIIGSAPLIGVYVTPQKLWKRMGVAVIDGQRQQRRSDPDEALMHGYAPGRRAELWSIADRMFMHQWRGDKEAEGDITGRPIGPYGFVYLQRKRHTLPRIAATEALAFSDRDKWTLARCDKDARRVMSKELLRDLWSVWHGHEARWPARWAAAQEAAEAEAA